MSHDQYTQRHSPDASLPGRACFSCGHATLHLAVVPPLPLTPFSQMHCQCVTTHLAYSQYNSFPFFLSSSGFPYWFRLQKRRFCLLLFGKTIYIIIWSRNGLRVGSGIVRVRGRVGLEGVYPQALMLSICFNSILQKYDWVIEYYRVSYG